MELYHHHPSIINQQQIPSQIIQIEGQGQGKRRCFMCLKAERDEQFTSFPLAERIKCFEPLLCYLTGACHDFKNLQWNGGGVGGVGVELSILIQTFKEVPPLCVGCCDILGDLYDLHQSLIEIQEKIDMQTGIARSIIKRSYQASGIVMESFQEAEQFRSSPVVKLRREILMNIENPVLFPTRLAKDRGVPPPHPPEVEEETLTLISGGHEEEQLMEENGGEVSGGNDGGGGTVMLLLQMGDDQVIAVPMPMQMPLPLPPGPSQPCQEEDSQMQLQFHQLEPEPEQEPEQPDIQILQEIPRNSSSKQLTVEETTDNPPDTPAVNLQPQQGGGNDGNFPASSEPGPEPETDNHSNLYSSDQNYQFFRIESCDQSEQPTFQPMLIKVPSSCIPQFITDATSTTISNAKNQQPLQQSKENPPIPEEAKENPPSPPPIQTVPPSTLYPPPSKDTPLPPPPPPFYPPSSTTPPPSQSHHPCDVCSLQIPKPEIFTHLKSHVGSQYVFECTYCEVAFLTPFRLDAYHKSRLKTYKCPLYNATLSLSAYLSCEKCFFKADTIFMLKKHLTTHESEESLQKTIKCPVCVAKFCLKSSVLIHLQDHHIFNKTKRRSESCEKCEKLLPVHELESHLKTVHGLTTQLLLRCALCPGVFSSLRGMIEHQLKAKARKIHQISCHLCNNSFNCIADLRSHYLQDHREARKDMFFCHYCLASNFGSEQVFHEHVQNCGGMDLRTQKILEEQQLQVQQEDREEFGGDEEDEEESKLVIDESKPKACKSNKPKPKAKLKLEGVGGKIVRKGGVVLVQQEDPKRLMEGERRPAFRPLPPLPYRPPTPPLKQQEEAQAPPRPPPPLHPAPSIFSGPFPRLKCHKCNMTFIRELPLRTHIRLAHDNPPPPPFPSDSDSPSSSTSPSYSPSPSPSSPPSPPTPKEAPAPKSPSSVLSKVDFGGNVLLQKGGVNDRPFACGICSRKFRNEGMLGCHVNAEHAKGKIESQEEYVKLREMVNEKNFEDVKKKVLERPYGCRMCGQRFRHISNRYTHEQGHERLGEKFKPSGPQRNRTEIKKKRMIKMKDKVKVKSKKGESLVEKIKK